MSFSCVFFISVLMYIISLHFIGQVAAGGCDVPFVEKSTVTVVAHSKEVNDVAVAPNNKIMASGGADKLARIWQFPSGDLLGECKGHRRPVWCVSPTSGIRIYMR